MPTRHDDLGPELPARLVIDRTALQWADKALDAVFNAAVSELQDTTFD